MSDAPVEGVEVVAYYVESFVPIENTKANEIIIDDLTAKLGLYLLDLMKAHGYRVVSGARYELPEPGIAPYPEGWTLLRVVVDVQEFDAEVGP